MFESDPIVKLRLLEAREKAGGRCSIKSMFL